mmetsp:Transcript_47062/g.124744  ORF Transcript_47062/g.124744 Transcript_47062/m.124744 type:complete len:396 (-) Transcript_47062:25-1212(-)
MEALFALRQETLAPTAPSAEFARDADLWAETSEDSGEPRPQIGHVNSVQSATSLQRRQKTGRHASQDRGFGTWHVEDTTWAEADVPESWQHQDFSLPALPAKPAPELAPRRKRAVPSRPVTTTAALRLSKVSDGAQGRVVVRAQDCRIVCMVAAVCIGAVGTVGVAVWESYFAPVSPCGSVGTSCLRLSTEDCLSCDRKGLLVLATAVALAAATFVAVPLGCGPSRLALLVVAPAAVTVAIVASYLAMEASFGASYYSSRAVLRGVPRWCDWETCPAPPCLRTSPVSPCSCHVEAETVSPDELARGFFVFNHQYCQPEEFGSEEMGLLNGILGAYERHATFHLRAQLGLAGAASALAIGCTMGGVAAALLAAGMPSKPKGRRQRSVDPAALSYQR